MFGFITKLFKRKKAEKPTTILVTISGDDLIVSVDWEKETPHSKITDLVNRLSGAICIIQTGQLRKLVELAVEKKGKEYSMEDVAQGINQISGHHIAGFFEAYRKDCLSNYFRGNNVPVIFPNQVFNNPQNQQ